MNSETSLRTTGPIVPNPEETGVSIKNPEQWVVGPDYHDSPLTPDELEMRFGEPVICSGVDLTKLSKLYRQALYGGVPDKEFEAWNARPLGEFLKDAFSSELEFLHRLLVLHDQMRRHLRASEVHQALVHHHGYPFGERTLRRQVAHARMALILAATGKVDFLPSQNVSAVVSSHLERKYWGRFLSEFQRKEAQSPAVKKALGRFSQRHRIPLRGQPLELPSPSVDVVIPLLESGPAGSPGADPVVVKGKECRKLRTRDLADLLESRLAGRIPASYLDDRRKFATLLVRELDSSIASVPMPGRHKKLDELFDELERVDPARAQAAKRAAIRLLLLQVSKKSAALAKKRADTPCPKTRTRP